MGPKKDKGKGKPSDAPAAAAKQNSSASASNDKSSAAAEPKAVKPTTFSGSGPAPLVTQYFSEPDGGQARGYNKALFEQAVLDLTEGAQEAEAARVTERKKLKDEKAAKVKDWSERIDFIVKELEISKSEAEDALIQAEGDLHKSLLQLTAPRVPAVQ